MADNVLHPITGTGTADITQRTFDLGSGVQAPAVVLIDETTGAAVGGTTAEGLKVNANHNGTAVTATWTSATADETTFTATCNGYLGVVLTVVGNNNGPSSGAIYVERDDGSQWVATRAIEISSNFGIPSTISFNVSDLETVTSSWYIPTDGAGQVRLRLETVIVGNASLAMRLVPTTVPHGHPSIVTSVAGTYSVVSSALSSTHADFEGVGVFILGSDGTVMRRILTDTTGRQQIVGAAADGAAVSGNPVRIGGKDGSGNTQDIATNTSGNLDVVGTVAVSSLPALVAGSANIGDVDVLTTPGQQVLGTDVYTEAASIGITLGAVRRDADTTLVNTTNEFSPLQVDALGRLKCEVFSGETLPVSGTVTANAGTGPFPVSDNASSLTVDAPLATPVNVQIGNATLAAGVIDETGASAVDALAVGGGTAHDAVDSGNPVKIGGVAVSGSATPTSVASADRTRWIFNQHGIPYVMSGHPNLITREYDFGTAAQTDVNLAAAAVAADERIYVIRFEALCDNANTVAVSVRAGFGTASVPAASSTGVSGMIASHPGIAAGSGIICGGAGGLIAIGGAGEEPRLTSTAATTGNLHVVISYFLIDETP